VRDDKKRVTGGETGGAAKISCSFPAHSRLFRG
jgi:hypothetical protein